MGQERPPGNRIWLVLSYNRAPGADGRGMCLYRKWAEGHFRYRHMHRLIVFRMSWLKSRSSSDQSFVFQILKTYCYSNPFYLVDAIIVVPYGSYPGNMAYEYFSDEDHLRQWLKEEKIR